MQSEYRKATQMKTFGEPIMAPLVYGPSLCSYTFSEGGRGPAACSYTDGEA